MKITPCLSVVVMILVVAALRAGTALAGSDSWKADVSGNWADSTSWTAGCVPGSTGVYNNDFATFGCALKADRVVTVDSNRCLGNILFGNPSAHKFTLAHGKLRVGSTDGWNKPGGIIQTLAGNGAHADTINSDILFDNSLYGVITAGASAPDSVLKINGNISATFYCGLNLTLNGENTGANAIAGVFGSSYPAGQISIIKEGGGSWTLSSSNTCGGMLTVGGGMLTLDAGAGGSFCKTNILTFTGSGIFNYDNTTATGEKSQTLGVLTNRAGEGTVQLTRTAAQNVSLTFTSLGARSVGATRHFVYSGTPGVTGSNSTITLQGATAGFVDQNSFVDGGDYAYVNGAGNFVRAPVYGVDGGFTAADTIAANTHVMLTRSPAAQNSVTVNTLKLAGRGVDFALNGGQTLTLANGGLLKTGGGPAIISGGAGASLSPSSELAVRTASSRDSLTISLPITGNQALTKSGAGTLILSGSNNFTGRTFVNGGTLSINSNSGLGDVATGATNNLDNATLQATASFTLDNGGANRRNIVVANNCSIDVTGANTLMVSGIVSGSGNLAKTGTGMLVLNGANVMGGAVNVVNGTLVIPASASISGATLSFGRDGTTVMQLSTSSVSICKSSVLTYGGTLVVTNVNASLVAGASFKLFDAVDYTGVFASISLPVLEPGLKWITADLPVNGTIRVVSPFSVAAVFTDNMVLQRDMKAPVWGEAEPGEKVTVEFGGQRKSVKAGKDRKWMVRLDAMAANATSQTLTVTGPGSITRVCANVLVGDVWLASGQSNMHADVPYVVNSAAEIALANYPLIRSLRVNLSGATAPVQEASLSRPWTVCSSNTVSKCSAVAYFFARDVFQKTKVPIGILESPNPGTIAEAWTSREALNAVPELRTFANLQIARYYQGKVNLTDAPGSLFNAMISPLIPFAIKGAIWYQGESNCHRGEQYRVLLPTLIQDWRSRWQQGAFPFYIVQLASFSAGWPYGDWDFRSVCEAQMLTSKTVTNTGLAVTIDICENAGDIHPKVKQDVGARLAAWALNRDYGFRDVVPSGPIFRSSKIEGNQIRLNFDYAEGGLMTGQKNGVSPVQELPGVSPNWFEIAGTNNVFTNAIARIDSNTVVVSSPAVPNPAHVRYGWFKIASGTNLYNRAGLPASPFRTE